MPSLESVLQQAEICLKGLTDSPRLDAEILLAHTIQRSRTYLRTWPEQLLTQAQSDQFESLLQQRQQGLPIAYLTGRREFWSREFYVSPDVLIPRPETELLVELCLALLPQHQPCRIIDLGTGSGVIAITLAAERPNAEVVATDFSTAALEVARFNAEKHRIKNLRFFHSHWFAAVTSTHFDLVASNPPYIAKHDPHLAQGDLRFEPKSSLISAQEGLADIRCLADQSRFYLKTGGHLLIEHGYDQATAVQKIFRDFGYDKVQTHADLSGHARITSGLHIQANIKP